jgi:hypothetical protein
MIFNLFLSKVCLDKKSFGSLVIDFFSLFSSLFNRSIDEKKVSPELNNNLPPIFFNTEISGLKEFSCSLPFTKIFGFIFSIKFFRNLGLTIL